MKHLKVLSVITLATIVLAATTVAIAAERDRNPLKKLGLKFYWSLLDADQQEQAKELLAVHLTETAADRTGAAARVLRFRAEVLEVLNHEQIRKAARIKKVMGALPKEKRAAVFDRLLDTTDRALFTERVERLAAAGPEERVRVGMELMDQLVDVTLAEYGPRLELSRDQELRIREAYSRLKTDLEPVALRLSAARARVTESALAILTAEQREKVGEFKDTVMEKVLGWLRG
jgi:hypothetical protein